MEAVVTAKRDKAVALKLLKRTLKTYARPRTVVTDGRVFGTFIDRRGCPAVNAAAVKLGLMPAAVKLQQSPLAPPNGCLSTQISELLFENSKIRNVSAPRFKAISLASARVSSNGPLQYSVSMSTPSL